LAALVKGGLPLAEVRESASRALVRWQGGVVVHHLDTHIALVEPDEGIAIIS
jgi:hypothetical protein